MTLQEIADYAMDYLDSKGIAAEYEITSDTANIYVNGSVLWFYESENKNSIEVWLDVFI